MARVRSALVDQTDVLLDETDAWLVGIDALVDQTDVLVDETDAWLVGIDALVDQTDERFIDAPPVVSWRQPSMNCVVERALAARHAVARHYGFFSVMRKR